MKKFAVALFMLITSASASAQYIVWDPTNYVQNAMTAAQTVQSVIQQVQSYATQIRQYEMEVRQLAAMPANAINTIKQIRNVNLSNVNGYINSLQSLYGNLNGISNQISTQFSAAQLSNKTWDQYMDKLKTDVQNGVSAAKTRAQNEANTLQSIQQDYEMAKQWQSMIPATAGTHESMQLMNTQMYRMVMQGAQMLQQLQAMNGADKAQEDLNKQIAKQRNGDALQTVDKTISTDNANMSNLVNGLKTTGGGWWGVAH